MADNNRMEKVDMTKEFQNLSPSDKHYLRKLERVNKGRAVKLMTMRKRNAFTGILLGVGVLSIYGYTMYAVRQEKFLEGFDTVPEDAKKNSS
ncbi:cytochrome c oxidase assembly factor 3, mitochondrial-like [Haliotis rubra]|uniref:cytochrome c oxidase assembly factor 3, mitochondrial-like n=1 Tax=Haliotis rubra TaxID=36100 RepID=UPI001EE615C6|nr:cytochrome c oxidase assembly factor 3, mitochondrial-like [Haliotis rubra]